MSSLITVNPAIMSKLDLRETFHSEEDNLARMKGFFMPVAARDLTVGIHAGASSGRPRSFLITGRPAFGKSHLALYLMNFLGQPAGHPVMEHIIKESQDFPQERIKADLGQFVVAPVPPIDMNKPSFNGLIITALAGALSRAGIAFTPPQTTYANEYCSQLARHVGTKGKKGILFVMDDFEPLMLEIERKMDSSLCTSMIEFFAFIRSFRDLPIFFVGVGSMFPMKYITRGMEEEAKRKLRQVFDEVFWMDYQTEEWVDFATSTILQHPSMEALDVLSTNSEFDRIASFVHDAGLFKGRDRDYIQHHVLPLCFPFHPFTLITLPRLSQKVCHTEKNLFSFFRDTGAGSFSHFLDTFGVFQASGKLSLISMDFLFAYYEQAIKEAPHLRHVSDAVNKAGVLAGSNPLSRKVIRALGLMNMIRDDVIKPTKKNIIGSLNLDDRETQKFEGLILDMVSKNGFKFDRATSEVSLPVQKSSINLGDFVSRRLERINQELDPVEFLNRSFPIPPVPARQYNSNYCSDRQVSCRYVNIEELKNPDFAAFVNASLGVSVSGYSGDVAILYMLIEDDDELSQAREIVSSAQWEGVSLLVFALPLRPASLSKVIREMAALLEIREQEGVFADTDTDERELLEDRIKEVEGELREKLEFFRRPDRLYWYYRGSLISQIQEKPVEELADAMMEENFPFTPVVLNPAVSSFADSESFQGVRAEAVEILLSRMGTIILSSYPVRPAELLLHDVLVSTGILGMVREAGDFSEYMMNGPLEGETPLAAVWNTLYARILQSAEEGIRVIPLNDVLWDLLQPPYGVNPALLEILLAAIFQYCPWAVEIFSNFRQMQHTGEHSTLVKLERGYDALWRMVHDPEDVIIYFSEHFQGETPPVEYVEVKPSQETFEEGMAVRETHPGSIHPHGEGEEPVAWEAREDEPLPGAGTLPAEAGALPDSLAPYEEMEERETTPGVIQPLDEEETPAPVDGEGPALPQEALEEALEAEPLPGLEEEEEAPQGEILPLSEEEEAPEPLTVDGEEETPAPVDGEGPALPQEALEESLEAEPLPGRLEEEEESPQGEILPLDEEEEVPAPLTVDGEEESPAPVDQEGPASPQEALEESLEAEPLPGLDEEEESPQGEILPLSEEEEAPEPLTVDGEEETPAPVDQEGPAPREEEGEALEESLEAEPLPGLEEEEESPQAEILPLSEEEETPAPVDQEDPAPLEEEGEALEESLEAEPLPGLEEEGEPVYEEGYAPMAEASQEYAGEDETLSPYASSADGEAEYGTGSAAQYEYAREDQSQLETEPAYQDEAYADAGQEEEAAPLEYPREEEPQEAYAREESYAGYYPDEQAAEQEEAVELQAEPPYEEPAPCAQEPYSYDEPAREDSGYQDDGGVEAIPFDEPYSTVEMPIHDEGVAMEDLLEMMEMDEPVFLDDLPEPSLLPEFTPEEKDFVDSVIGLFTGNQPPASDIPLWEEGRDAILSWFESLPPMTRNARPQKEDDTSAFLALMKSGGTSLPPREFFSRALPSISGFQGERFPYETASQDLLTSLKNVHGFLGRYRQLKAAALLKAIKTVFTGKDGGDFQGIFNAWVEGVPADYPIQKFSSDARLLVQSSTGTTMEDFFLRTLPGQMGIGPIDSWETDRNMEYISRLSKAKLEVDVSFIITAFELPAAREPKMKVAREVFDKTLNGFQLSKNEKIQYVQAVLKELGT
jgi:hypothetical protein